MAHIFPPWSKKTTEGLNRWQQSDSRHPFTCGKDNCQGILVASAKGLTCPEKDCNYTQDWAHDFMILEE